MTTKEQLQAVSAKLNDLRETTALLSLELAIKRFNPNQPRWPSGRSEGGQWRPAQGTQVATFTHEGTYDGSRLAGCLDQMALDEAICRRFGRRLCWERSDERFINCTKNVYVPPLGWGGR